MLLLSEKQVKTLLDIDELIETLERAHVQYSTGKAVMPVRLVVPLPQIQGRITSMPGFLDEEQSLGMKVVTYFQENPRRGLPAILATIMLFSAETGKLIAAMDGSYITAVRNADIVVTVTTAKEPILKSDWLKPGAHINAVGSHRPDLREIDGATLACAKIFVDSREAIMAECGDILLALKEKSISPDAIHAEIGEMLAGAKSARIGVDEITLYKSVGIAIQDVAAAALVYRKASQRGVGTNAEI